MWFFPFGIVELGLVVVLVVVALVLVGRRARPDPTGRRPIAIYLLSVMFITLFTAAGAIAQMGRTFSQNVTDGGGAVWAVTEGRSFSNYEPILEGGGFEPLQPQDPATAALSLDGSGSVSELLQSVLILGLAAAIFEFHRRQWNILLRKETGDG